MEMKTQDRVPRDRGDTVSENQKKPYARPTIVLREAIEAVAAACTSPGKSDGSCAFLNS